MKNIGLKLVSLIAAILLSYFVQSEGNRGVFTVMVPIELRNLPAKMALAGGELPHVQVTLRGPSFVLARIPAAPPVFRVQIPEDVGPRYRAELRASDLALPPFVQVAAIQPSDVELAFESVSEVAIPVNVPLIGAVDKDFKVEAIAVHPESVTVRGGASAVVPLEVIQAEPIDISGAKKTVSRTVPLRLPAGALQSSMTEVGVEVKISPIEVSRSFTGIPVEVRSSGAGNYAITPPAVSVEIVGRRSLVEAADRNHVIPFVRLGKEYVEREAVEVGVELPDGVRAARVDPPKVEVIRSPRGTGGGRAVPRRETAKKQ